MNYEELRTALKEHRARQDAHDKRIKAMWDEADRYWETLERAFCYLIFAGGIVAVIFIVTLLIIM